ncbi:MAG: hypothetical protein QGG26_16285 [Candidatus Undinarchaeales archaeon]|jgi:hypothetical protein|nr:hypothetical protein [Candidatus Undinarchaeales archaeon]
MVGDEDLLRPPEREMKPYPPKVITLVSGEKLLIRQAEREEVPKLLDAVRPLTTVAKDYYDIVASRVYAELLGWYRYRVRDEYCLVGLIDGEIVGIVNGRIVDDKTGMSYHTMALKRGLRVGAHLFPAKMEYHFMMDQEEVLVVAESPIGFRRWMEELRLEPKNEVHHELGGVDSWVLTKENFETFMKPEKLFGERPVPDEIIEANKEIIVPPPEEIRRRVTGEG